MTTIASTPLHVTPVVGTGLSIDALTVRIPWRRGRTVHAVTDVSIRIEPGTITALVGESGCGKSVVALAAMGLLPPSARIGGRITVGDNGRIVDLLHTAESFRGRTIGMVPQSPSTHFTPVHTVGAQIAETIRAVGSPYSVSELIRRVDFPAEALDRYPHELSGGMVQRAAIAAAIAADPPVVIADEPTAHLDQQHTDTVLALLRGCAKRGSAVLLITHDIGALLRTSIADRIAVMYASRIMEEGPAEHVLEDPWHDYTADLLNALPERGLHPIPGMPPELTNLGDDCVYHLRRPETQHLGGPTMLVTRENRTVRTRRP
ncbi:ABC transporter ATP-binding protein [Hoyosella rhizosphaerae]|uniref:Nickel import system ATP-binding protein NikD n=1 Tax=Hoyosella rhizosphaerae TaxID=1755582 RepID=A0A916U2H5_9ACTN|nr:ABC transporter ATP-binding protein [Hoyosella rhizosphaerae]MBN4926697.1 ABC transporter ATP-binding protein [Hoyosella rhizosphaerae]GGC57123.1 ABC transporter ATP-binding protein [Hoyosella rhizosphaerae]